MADAATLTREDRSDLTFQLLTEFSFTALQSLIDIAGSYRAIELNRPYWHHAGKAAGLVAMQSFPQMTKDLQGWSFMNRFIEAVFRRGRRASSSTYSLAQQGVSITARSRTVLQSSATFSTMWSPTGCSNPWAWTMNFY